MRKHSRVRLTVRLVVAGMALVLLATDPAFGHHRPQPHFRDVHCFKPDYSVMLYRYEKRSRDDSRSYASTAIGDGYQWGGGCWNGNGVDDQPGDPPRDHRTGGEGGDCSGFVFKSWYLRENTSSSGFQWYTTLHYIHGPYTADRFRRGSGAPIMKLPKAEAAVMDAFASTGHIGMVWAPRGAPNGQDLIIEAANTRDGTNVWARTYRSNPNYEGVRRANWKNLEACGDYCGWVYDE